MTGAAIRTLVALELRRAFAIVPRIAIVVGTIVALTALAGWLTPSRLGLLLGVVCATFIMQGPVGVLADKENGGLELLTSLPLPAGTIALGRFAYALIASVPGAVALVLATWPADPTFFAALPGSPWSLFAGAWLFTLLGSFVAIGCALRFDPGAVMTGFGVLVFASIAMDEVGGRLVPDPLGTAQRLAQQPWLPAALWGGSFLLVLIVAGLSFHLARTGVERFTPGRDRIGG